MRIQSPVWEMTPALSTSRRSRWPAGTSHVERTVVLLRGVGAGLVYVAGLGGWRGVRAGDCEQGQVDRDGSRRPGGHVVDDAFLDDGPDQVLDRFREGGELGQRQIDGGGVDPPVVGGAVRSRAAGG